MTACSLHVPPRPQPPPLPCPTLPLRRPTFHPPHPHRPESPSAAACCLAPLCSCMPPRTPWTDTCATGPRWGRRGEGRRQEGKGGGAVWHTACPLEQQGPRRTAGGTVARTSQLLDRHVRVGTDTEGWAGACGVQGRGCVWPMSPTSPPPGWCSQSMRHKAVCCREGERSRRGGAGVEVGVGVGRCVGQGQAGGEGAVPVTGPCSACRGHCHTAMDLVVQPPWHTLRQQALRKPVPRCSPPTPNAHRCPAPPPAPPPPPGPRVRAAHQHRGRRVGGRRRHRAAGGDRGERRWAAGGGGGRQGGEACA